MKYFCLLILFFWQISWSQGSFEILIEPFQIERLPLLDAFAYGQYDNYWLIIGGHIMEPHEAGYDRTSNYNFIVVDPISGETWFKPFEEVFPYLIDPSQLTSCYMAYHQEGNYLYLAGGYGYSSIEKHFIDYPYLLEIDLAGMIGGIVSNRDIQWYARQVMNERFSVKDGYLTKVGNRFYLFKRKEFIRIMSTNGGNQDVLPGPFQAVTFQLREEDHQLTVSNLKEYRFEDFKYAGIGVMSPEIIPGDASPLSVFYYAPGSDDTNLGWMNIFDVGYSRYEAFSGNKLTLKRNE